MGYRRETMVVRGPGGHRAGFLIWERGTRQASLRCNLDGLRPEAELLLCWVEEGGFALREGDALRADAAGAVRHVQQIAGDAPPVAVALVRGDGSLYAYALSQGAPLGPTGAPERLQALLPKKGGEEGGDEPRADAPVPEPEPDPGLESSSEPTSGLSDAPEPVQERLHPLWRAAPWPPPPGLPGARWRDGCWGDHP